MQYGMWYPPYRTMHLSMSWMHAISHYASFMLVCTNVPVQVKMVCTFRHINALRSSYPCHLVYFYHVPFNYAYHVLIQLCPYMFIFTNHHHDRESMFIETYMDLFMHFTSCSQFLSWHQILIPTHHSCIIICVWSYFNFIHACFLIKGHW